MNGSRTGALLISAALIASTVAVSGLLLFDAEGGPEPLLRERSHEAPARTGPRLRIAGSGSNVPITRRLADAYRRARPDVSIVVHDSVGSTGGIRAVADGVVDLGLASRPLTADEKKGVSASAYARVPVVVAVHADTTDTNLSTKILLDIYRGAHTRWSDGSTIVVVQREHGDSSHRSVARALPGFDRANAEAWRERRFVLVYSDRAMEAELIRVRGSVGIADLGAITTQRLPLRALSIDGVKPSPEAVVRGDYPFSKDLSFVWRGDRSSGANDFLAFVASPAGQLIIREAGYVPLPSEAK